MTFAQQPVLDRRRAGVLLHPTSLPSGKLDKDAVRFLDFLKASGFSVWQTLPVGPTGSSGSPYSPYSAFAGNPDLIPDDVLTQQPDEAGLEQFYEDQKYWLYDFAMFSVIRQKMQGIPWWEWPDGLRQRDPAALDYFEKANSQALNESKNQQYNFSRIWRGLKRQAQDRGILLFGDLPMFVVADSADVWAHRHLFRLDSDGRANLQAGAPPDAFSQQGQCWGNPVYNWEQMRSEQFDWWVERLRKEFSRFDLLRWDHFAGLVAGWEIPVGDEPDSVGADQGQWRRIPGDELLKHLAVELDSMNLVAENLGIITEEIEQLRRDHDLPGMHVLQFAFDGTTHNPHFPDRHESLGVVYTGTHDNDTTRGWFEKLDPETRQRVTAEIDLSENEMPTALILLALESRCRLAMLPLQDMLGLDSGARMNIPGQADNQWQWQFSWSDIDPNMTSRFHKYIQVTDRS